MQGSVGRSARTGELRSRSVVELCPDGLPLNVGPLSAASATLLLPGPLWPERASAAITDALPDLGTDCGYVMDVDAVPESSLPHLAMSDMCVPASLDLNQSYSDGRRLGQPNCDSRQQECRVSHSANPQPIQIVARRSGTASPRLVPAVGLASIIRDIGERREGMASAAAVHALRWTE